MNHRHAAILTAILCLFSLPTQAAQTNVMFITLDDMHWDSVGVYGAKVEATTPNIDRLAEQGLRFEHAHVTIAICQPTRAVWMTGRYPHNNGALGFNHIRRGVPTLPETLRAAGFHTGILGKTEHVVPSRPNAFAYRRDRSEMKNGRSAELYGKFADEFFQQAKQKDQPFFLMVNAHDPHRPFDNRVPAERRRGRDYQAPTKIYQADEIVVPPFLPDLPKVREEIAQYYSSVRRADDVVGTVLASLKAVGFADNTLVILMSDHGMPLPFAKTNVWRNSTRTPCIVRWPGVVKPASHDTKHLISGIDLAPTILDALQVKPMDDMDGRSFLPILKGEPQKDRDVVFTHINTIASGNNYPMRSVQTDRLGLIWNGWSDGTTKFRNESQSGITWKAMVAAAESDPQLAARVQFYSYRVPWEFYNYEDDPDALNNLIDDPKWQPEIKRLTATMRELMTSSGDSQLAAFEKTLAESAVER